MYLYIQAQRLIKSFAKCVFVATENIVIVTLAGLFHINLLKPTGHVMHQQFNI
jgi:hypothetical protein